LLDAHTVAEERCNVKAEVPVDGMTRKMKDQIQCRKKSHPGQTDAERWEAIYKILFPDEVVPDPCKLKFPCLAVFLLHSLGVYITALVIVTHSRKTSNPYQITTSKDKDFNLQTL
jgi:hypothetical protein